MRTGAVGLGLSPALTKLQTRQVCQADLGYENKGTRGQGIQVQLLQEKQISSN